MCKKLTILTDKELNTTKKLLDAFERQTTSETGVSRISGGFAIANMTHYDEDSIYIRLKWGVQSDCQNDSHEEEWYLTRSILNDTKIPLNEKVDHIDN